VSPFAILDPTRPRIPRPAGSSPLRGWSATHPTSLPIVLGLLLLGAWVLGTGIRHYPAFADDEGT
jgi:hypothetical protein